MHKSICSYPFIVLSIVIIGLNQIAVAQSKPISGYEYYSAYRRADELKSRSSWRSVRSEEASWSGHLTTTRQIDEATSSQNLHSVWFGDRDGKAQTYEFIRINKDFYCRSNEGSWSKSRNSCPPDYGRFMPSDAKTTATVEHSVSKGIQALLYQIRSVYRESDGVERFFQEKIWIDKDGRMLACEGTSGAVVTNEVTDHYLITYEYNPRGLRIVAPIK